MANIHTFTQPNPIFSVCFNISYVLPSLTTSRLSLQDFCIIAVMFRFLILLCVIATALAGGAKVCGA